LTRGQRIPFFFAPDHTNLYPPRRDLAVFFLAHEVELGGADVAVAGELADLVHLRAVADGVVDGSFTQRVDADAALPQPVGVDSCRPAVFLHHPPGHLAVEVTPHQHEAVRVE